MAKRLDKNSEALLKRLLMEPSPSEESVERLFDVLLHDLSPEELKDIDRRRANVVADVQKTIKRNRNKRTRGIVLTSDSWCQQPMVARGAAPTRRRRK